MAADTKVIRRLFTAIGFIRDKGTDEVIDNYEQDTDTLIDGAKGVEDQLEKATAQLGNLYASLVAGGTAVVFFTNKLTEQISLLGNFSDATGIASDKVQALTIQARGYGLSVEQTLELLNRANITAGEFRAGVASQSRIDILGLAGISDFSEIEDGYDLLVRLSDSFKELSGDQRSIIAETLQFSRETIPLLANSEGFIKTLATLKRQGLIITPDEIRAALEYQQASKGVYSRVVALSQVIAIKAIPALTKIVEGIDDWIIANDEFFKQDFTRLLLQAVDALSVFGSVLTTVLKVVLEIADLFGGLDVLLWIFLLARVSKVVGGLAILLGGSIGKLAKLLGFGAAITTLMGSFILILLRVPIIIGSILLLLAAIGEDLFFTFIRKGEKNTLFNQLINAGREVGAQITAWFTKIFDFLKSLLNTVWTIVEEGLIRAIQSAIDKAVPQWLIDFLGFTSDTIERIDPVAATQIRDAVTALPQGGTPQDLAQYYSENLNTNISQPVNIDVRVNATVAGGVGLEELSATIEGALYRGAVNAIKAKEN